MKVLVVPADEMACGSNRMIWPAQALIDQGYDVTIVKPSDSTDDQIQAKTVVLDGVERVLRLEARPDADVVVLQRPLKRMMVDGIKILQQAGVRVVVEVDDDFSSIDPRNAAFWACQPTHGVYVYPDGTERLTGGPNRNWHNIADACKLADLVTVTTPALAKRYGGHGRVAVLPNFVPESYLSIEGWPHDDVVVGWAGSVHSHPADLKVVGVGVRRALATTGARFSVVGSGDRVREGLNLAEDPVATGYLSLDEYPHAVACFDIGIAPLVDSAFNRAKSGLKMLEYAALGVVPVGSPTPDNLRLQRIGLGMTVDKPKDWQRWITRLAHDADLRGEWRLTAHARAETMTYEHNCELWWNAWATALHRRASPGTAVRSVSG